MFIVAALLLGFMGSAHCVGMCGPLVLAMPYGRGSQRHLNMGIYHIMRSIMYALMGLLIGLLGVGFHLAGWQSPISIAAGLMVIAIGTWQLMGNGSFKINITSRRIFRLRQRHLSRPAGVGKNAVLGFLNGLLPCGLVYTALAASIAAGGLWESALFMFIFGLATIPALYILGWLPSVFPGFKGRALQRFIPVVTIIVGLLFVLRGLELGIPYLSPPSEALSVESPSCCSKPSK